MDVSIGPIAALFGTLVRVIAALIPGKVNIHRKSNDDESVSFWIVHNPKYPGQPLWAEVSICGHKQRERISVAWPSGQLGLPFGIEGNNNKACYVSLHSAAYAALAVEQGRHEFRVSDNPQQDNLARSKWTDSSHVRACLQVRTLTKERFWGDWIKIQILDTSRKVQAISIIRTKSI